MSSNSSCIKYQDKSEELCKGIYSQKPILFETKSTFSAANYFCQAFGGHLFVPKSDADAVLLASKLIKSKNCSRTTIGLKKYKDKVLDLNENNVSYINWDRNQPNGEESQKCIELKQNALYNDYGCNVERCYACQIPTKNMYNMRGKISSDTDQHFYVGMSDNHIEIRGFQKTICNFNGTWIFGNYSLTNYSNPLQPPVGTRIWNKYQSLKFTQCRSDQFTCHTYGNCISIDKRCDGHPDCPLDGSDEKGCKFMTYLDGYNKKYPSGRNTTIVYIKVGIEDIYDIHELELDYTVRLKVSLAWYDNRITFRNLKKENGENLLDITEIENIWFPQVVFSNSKNKLRVKAGNGDDMTIGASRRGIPIQNPLYEIDEDYLYSGSENMIWFSSSSQVKLRCQFDLAMYPFDTQRCPIDMEVPYEYFSQFRLQLLETPLYKNFILGQFEFLNIEHSTIKTDSESINIMVKLRRIPTYHLTNTYIPTLCLIIITELTLFIDVSHFEATIMVALTTMLVTYTLYQSLLNYLPQTPYLKMIDIWLFSGLILPFIIICFLIALDSLVLNEKSQITSETGTRKKWNAKFIMKIMQIVIPTATIILGLLYSLIAIYNYYS